MMIKMMFSHLDGMLSFTGLNGVVEKKSFINNTLQQILMAMLTQLANINPILPNSHVSTKDAIKYITEKTTNQRLCLKMKVDYCRYINTVLVHIFLAHHSKHKTFSNAIHC